MKNVFHATVMVVLATGLLVGCGGSHYKSSRGYTPEQQARIVADTQTRKTQSASKLDTFRASRETISDAFVMQRTNANDLRPINGVRVRTWHYFEGQFEFVSDPFQNNAVMSYASGTYHAMPEPGKMASTSFLMNHGQYRGRFKLFFDPPQPAFGRIRIIAATYVMAGTFIRHDGMQEDNIYIAEVNYLLGKHDLNFIPATPEYLAQLEQRYADQIAAWREEVERKAASKAMWTGLVGKALMLGLGGLVLANANLPDAITSNIASRLSEGVMTGDMKGAMLGLAQDSLGSALGMGGNDSLAGTVASSIGSNLVSNLRNNEGASIASVVGDSVVSGIASNLGNIATGGNSSSTTSTLNSIGSNLANNLGNSEGTVGTVIGESIVSGVASNFTGIVAANTRSNRAASSATTSSAATSTISSASSGSSTSPSSSDSGASASASSSSGASSDTGSNTGGYRYEQYTVTCKMTGVSNTFNIPYKSASCLPAKKRFTEVYACNLIDDFQTVLKRCQQECGHPSCDG